MSVARSLKRASALIGTLAILSNVTAAFAESSEGFDHGHYWNHGAGWQDDDFDRGSLDEKIALLRKKVKYVFVIFHENESFDHYFGTFPGANGLFSAPKGATPANQTPSFVQKYLDTSLNPSTISPFLLPQAVVTTQAGTQVRRGRSCRSIPPTRSRSTTRTRAWRTASISIRRPALRRTTVTRWIKRA